MTEFAFSLCRFDRDVCCIYSTHQPFLNRVLTFLVLPSYPSPLCDMAPKQMGANIISDSGYKSEEKPDKVAVPEQEEQEQEESEEEVVSDGEVSVSILEATHTEVPSSSTDQPTGSTTVTAKVSYKSVTVKFQVEKNLDLNSLIDDMEMVKEQLDELSSSDEGIKLKQKQELLILTEVAKMRLLSETINKLKKEEKVKKPKKNTAKPDKSTMNITLRFQMGNTMKTLTIKQNLTIGDLRRKLVEEFGLRKKVAKVMTLTFGETVISESGRATICGDTLKDLGVDLKENNLIKVTV